MPEEPVEVTVDTGLCVGSGTCAGLAPTHFRIGDDGRATPIESKTRRDPDLEDAEASCPVQAISIQAR